MAGEGQRFKDAGYGVPKPLLPIGRKRMIDAVVDNVRSPNCQFIFIHRAEHDIHPDSLPKESVLIPVSEMTQGAACTVLLARHYINHESPILIVNSDQLVELSMAKFIEAAGRLDGQILTFPSHDPKWSYAAVDKSGLVTRVAEKDPISSHATAGIYYFRSGAAFVRAADAMIDRNIRTKGEFYLCPVYNQLIENGGKVGIYEISAKRMHGLGTPEDYEAYTGSSLRS